MALQSNNGCVKLAYLLGCLLGYSQGYSRGYLLYATRKAIR